MTDSAERPLIGPDPAGDENAPDGIAIEQERDHIPDEADRDVTSSPFAAGWLGRDDPDDGPVIRRMKGPAAPRMFAHQLDRGDDEPDDCLPPPRMSRQHTHPAEVQRVGYDAHAGPVYRSDAFSVAAIREKRMRRPAGTHTPTRMGTKLTVAALASVCMISAGVALGLYGQDMGRYIEQHARSASSEVSNAVGRLMAAAASSLDQGSNGATQANLAGSAVPPKPADEVAAATAPASVTGRKLIYERLPVEQDDTARRDEAAPAREARAMAVQPVSGLDQLLAPPADFSTPGLQID
jgi:hypothetical protein